MANEDLNRNRPPNPEEASQGEYRDAFDAIDVEVQTSGQLDYKASVTVSGEEWINGVRVPYADSQPTMDLDEVPASELLSRIPEDLHEAVAAIGIKPEDADRQSVFLSFTPACFVKTDQGNDEFMPASALAAVTTEYPNGGSDFSSYGVEVDFRTDPAESNGTYTRMTDVGTEDVSMAEEEGSNFDPNALAALAMMDKEFAPEVRENTREAREKMTEDLSEQGEEVGARTDTAREGGGARYFLKSAEVEAVRIVAQYYSAPPDRA